MFPFEFLSEPSWSNSSKHDSALLSDCHVRRFPSQAGALSAKVAVPDEGTLHDQRTGHEKLFNQAARVAQGEQLHFMDYFGHFLDSASAHSDPVPLRGGA